jgi:SPP1 gp7 family putative phage head morphogenesis protein
MPPKKPKEFDASKRLEREYAAGVRKITGRVLSTKLPEESLNDWLKRLEARSQEKDIQDASELLARRLVQWSSVRNARTWREAAARAQHSRALYNALEKEMRGPTGLAVNRIIQQNAKLISSVAPEAASKLVDEVRKAQQRGARPATIAKMYRKRFPELTRSRIHLISRTEAQKASAALTQARAEELGLQWYEWLTSSDVRVRDSHKKMNDVLVPYNDPPDPEALVGEKSTLGHYHAGNCPNCRCGQAPVLNPDDVTWPRRVYWNGSIHQLTKQKFLALPGNQPQRSRAA